MSRFDKDAKTWDANERRQKVAKSVVDNIAANVELKKEFFVLDYGCGTGLVSYQMLNFVDNIMGMDNSQKMLEEFLSKKDDNKKVSAMLHNIDKDDLPINRFNLIVSSMTIHHIKNLDRFFSQAYLALAKNGYLAIADLEKEDGTFHDRGNDDVVHFGFEKNQISNLFSKNGFDIVNYEVVFTVKKNNKNYNIFTIIGKKM
jgi:predicted TPR repeat methyltransferase